MISKNCPREQIVRYFQEQSISLYVRLACVSLLVEVCVAHVLPDNKYECVR